MPEELRVDQRVWIQVRLPGVVLGHQECEEDEPYSGTRVVLNASFNQLQLALSRGTVRRSEIMTSPPKKEVWNPRTDLAIDQKVEADFTFAGTIIWTPEVEFPNDPETSYGIKLVQLDAWGMRHLYVIGELMPGQRIHKLPLFDQL
ncbi:hypothetical protein KJ713_00380 [Patescibacteria group bacterium]|nr:hypothetical protein [Patescibacteria group bacterium]